MKIENNLAILPSHDILGQETRHSGHLDNLLQSSRLEKPS